MSSVKGVVEQSNDPINEQKMERLAFMRTLNNTHTRENKDDDNGREVKGDDPV